ncbi:hypothetical protein BH09DEP1_BH09DEP1_3100 [soil metagenome]
MKILTHLKLVLLLLQCLKISTMHPPDTTYVRIMIINKTNRLMSTTHSSEGYVDIPPGPFEEHFFLNADYSQKINTPSGNIYSLKVVMANRYDPQTKLVLFLREPQKSGRAWQIINARVAEVPLISHRQMIEIIIDEQGIASIAKGN